MTAREDIQRRLFGLAVGALLLGEGYGLWRPQALGGLPQPDLGPFSHYRLVVALLSAGAGLVVLMAALLREPTPVAPARLREAGPLVLDLAPAAQAGAPPAASPPSAPESEVLAHELDPSPQPLPAPPSFAEEDIDDLDPFPGMESLSAPAEDVPSEAQPTLGPAPPPQDPAPNDPGTRARFLDLADEAHHLRAAGRLEEAGALYAEALGLARRRAAAEPSDPTALRDLACALTHMGDLEHREGRLEAAIALHEESLRVRRTFVDAAPDNLAALRALSLGLERLAEARDARGHRNRARDLYRLRLELDGRLARMEPRDPELAAAVTLSQERVRALDEALAV